MTAEKIGFWGGLVVFAVMLALPAPVGMEPSAWHVAALTILMATWWMTQTKAQSERVTENLLRNSFDSGPF